MAELIDCLLKRNIKAVIFDLDDTLYPEMQYVESGFKAVCGRIKEDYGSDCFGLMLEIFNRDRADVYNRTLDELKIGYDKNYILSLVEIYRSHKPELCFYSDVMPFISALKKCGIKTGIITDGRIEGQRLKMQALGCYEIFDGIIITDELGGEKFRKPSKIPFELMCKKLKVGLSEIAYIGDNPAKDFYIGTEGVFTVKITRKDALYTNAEYLENVKENLAVGSLI